jgi:DNA processing protein
MKIKKIAIDSPYVPDKLRNIPNPPQTLYTKGADVKELLQYPFVTVVGTRKVSTYGKEVTTKLTGELARAGVGIVSGLAIGVDGLAHRAALEAGAPTIAVLPGGLDRIYPRSHVSLAQRILEQGGALVSEYPEGTTPYKINFIARNRIASGLGDALLITEAAENSGTMHTARFALEQGREVLAVPGNITSPGAGGTNNLIKSGATPVTSVDDIFHALGIEPQQAKSAPKSHDPNEQALLNLLSSGVSDGAELLAASQLEVSQFNQTLTMLEIRGHIRPLGGNHWALT